MKKETDPKEEMEIRSIKMLLPMTPKLKELFLDATKVYDQGLYYYRQEVIGAKIEGRKANITQTRMGKKDENGNNVIPAIYTRIQEKDDWKNSKFFDGVKNTIITKAFQNTKGFLNSLRKHAKDKPGYKAPPRLPGYLKKQNRLAVIPFCNQVIMCKKRLNEKKHTIELPSTGLKIKIPQHIEFSQLRDIKLIDYHNKVKAVISYKKNPVEKPELDRSRVLGIDIGEKILVAMTTDNQTGKSIIIRNDICNSINDRFNDLLAKYKSILDTVNNDRNDPEGKNCKKPRIRMTKRLHMFYLKRENKIEYLFHNFSKWIVDFCVENKIGIIVIGRNKMWKIDIANKNDEKVKNSEISRKKATEHNRKFIQIPFRRLIHMITYKAKEFGIKVLETEESYTSMTDHLAKETMEKHDKPLGNRETRGCFKSSTGRIVHADVNGAIGMLRKKNLLSDEELGKLKSRKDIASPTLVKFEQKDGISKIHTSR